MAWLGSLWQALRRYCDDDDPLVATANLVALVVAWNQPFYPLYVYWSVSDVVWPTFFTFLSTPLFAAVPAVSRLNRTAGRALLPLTGIANTMLSAKAFGTASGVEIFLIPIVLLAVVLFRPAERIFGLAISLLALIVFMGLHGRYGSPFHLYSAEEYAGFLTLNAVSAGTLTMFVGLLLAGLLADRAKG